MDRADFPSSKTARPVASIRSAYGIRTVGRAALPPAFPDDHRSQTGGPATKLPRHCEGRSPRGNLRHDVSVRLAPINIVHPGFSMLICISARPTAVLEIATPYGLAMTAEEGGWSRFAGSAVVIAERTAERS